MSKKVYADQISEMYKNRFGFPVKMNTVMNSERVIGLQSGYAVVCEAEEGQQDMFIKFSPDMMANPFMVASELSFLKDSGKALVTAPHCIDVTTGETVHGQEEALEAYLKNRRQETIQMVTEFAAEKKAAQGQKPELDADEKRPDLQV